MTNGNGITAATSTLSIQNLHVSVEGKEILRGLNLDLKKGEVQALMGPNGTGKSTLAYTLMGHPRYQVTEGQICLDGENILDLPPDERARRGIFLAFQYPTAVPGVAIGNFLRQAIKAVRGKEVAVSEFRKLLREKMALLKIDQSMMGRYLNEGFSGGEKKRAEILQMALLEPQFAVLDETDSGLDIDALRIVSEGVNALQGPNLGILIITHYQRILNYIKPDVVHVLYGGRIVKTGGPELVAVLEEQGYDPIIRELDVIPDVEEREGNDEHQVA
jgi:Fe-S cluster assembly ATP-binding protein